jgi:hypothetical protein
VTRKDSIWLIGEKRGGIFHSTSPISPPQGLNLEIAPSRHKPVALAADGRDVLGEVRLIFQILATAGALWRSAMRGVMNGGPARRWPRISSRESRSLRAGEQAEQLRFFGGEAHGGAVQEVGRLREIRCDVAKLQPRRRAGVTAGNRKRPLLDRLPKVISETSPGFCHRVVVRSSRFRGCRETRSVDILSTVSGRHSVGRSSVVGLAPDRGTADRMSAANSVQNERAPVRDSRQPLDRALEEDKLKLELWTVVRPPGNPS